MTEIDLIIDQVSRSANRVKNTGNLPLYRKGLKTIRVIRKTAHLPSALQHEANYLDTIKKNYTGITPNMISFADVTDATDSYSLGQTSIDYGTISTFEGGQHTTGYIPESSNGDPVDNSGVSIGTAVDIGQMSVDQINNLDIPQELKDKLIPFAGLTGTQAQDALDKLDNDLTISTADADALDKAIREKSTSSLISEYNKSSDSANFYALPPQMQTVIASVSYQYGDLPTACPKFWAAVTNQDWTTAEQELRNFGDHFPTRRTNEANILQQGIQKSDSAPTPPPATPTPPPDSINRLM